MRLKIYKSFIFMLTACVSILVLSATAFAGDEEASDSYYWLIDDQADLLTDEEEEALYDYIDPILDYGNVIFSTVNLPSGSDYEGNCEDTYYYYFENEPGIHFQIDMGNRKLTLSASTGMETLIGSERTSIVDNIYTMATDGDYYLCAAECFNEVMTVINDGVIAHDMKHIDNAILAVILALIGNFVFIFFMNSKTPKTKTNITVNAVTATAAVTSAVVTAGAIKKIYSPTSSDSGGSSGGGGGGFSGGSSSHGF